MITDAEILELERLLRDRDVEEARSSFWRFCQVMAPDFYQDHRFHLFELCRALQNLYEGKPQNDGNVYTNIMINKPPQFGKTRTVGMWVDWVLGQSVKERFILGSYSDDPAIKMSRNIRNQIAQEKNQEDQIVYSDIFPGTKLKHGDSAVKRWSLDGEHFNFLAAGIIGGAVTGDGATIQIYDDLIKGREQALNTTHLDKVWGNYISTFGTRKDASVQVPLKLMIATRWCDGDPCGRELQENPEDWYVIKMQAYDEDSDEMLCEDFMNREQYFKKLNKSQTNPIEEQMFLANYQQETVDKKNILYAPFKEYEGEPPPGIRKAQTDSADTGDDYLMTFFYIEDHQGYCYIVDCLYTQEGMEVTEPEHARLLIENETQVSSIESNNGGRGYSRAVERIVKQDYNNHRIQFNSYHQSKNKESRILSNAATVNKMVLFPKGWKHRWPLVYKHLSNYKKNFKANKTDDIPDVLTAMVEHGPTTLKVKRR